MSRLVCLSLLSFAAWAADNNVVFRSDVALVRVDTQVVDRDNRALTGLRAEDFVLREEGRPQPIRNFASENMPVDVVLLLDVSASMRPHVQRIADASHQALRALADDDRVAIMVFDRSTRLRLPFRANRADVEREFENLLRQETFSGGTDITRGLIDAARYVERDARKDARRAIVILTDDQTERNRDEAAVSRALLRADAVLCALIAPDAMGTGRPGGGYPGGGYPGGGYPGGGWPGGGRRGGPLGGVIIGGRGGPYGGRGPTMRGPRTQSAGTAEIARQSGGDSMPVDDAYALESTLARIRQRYALHFYLPADVKAGQERTIDVQLADAARRRYPGAELRYRRQYLAPSDGGATPAPTVVTQAPVTSAPVADSGTPGLKRRPGVSQPDSSMQGPLGGEAGSNTAPQAAPAAAPASQGGWRRATPADTGTADPAAGGGWPKVKPGQQQ